MNKISIILSREYFIRVKKKSFLLTTIGIPLIIMGFYAAIIYISLSGSDEKQKIAVIDEANLFGGKIDNHQSSIEFKFIKNETADSYIKKYKKDGYQSFLFIYLKLSIL